MRSILHAQVGLTGTPTQVIPSEVTLDLTLAVLDFVLSENGRFLREPLIDVSLLALQSFLNCLECLASRSSLSPAVLDASATSCVALAATVAACAERSDEKGRAAGKVAAAGAAALLSPSLSKSPLKRLQACDERSQRLAVH